MTTFWTPLDVSDVGEALSFFAVQSISDEKRWYYRYGLTLESTRRYGSSGKVGDGDDYILAEGNIVIPDEIEDEGDVGDYLAEFASENVPEVPTELVDEFTDDMDLCEMSDVLSYREFSSFAELYFDVVGIESPDDIDFERAEAVKRYASENGWEFDLE